MPHIPEQFQSLLLERIETVIERVTFDDSGIMGRGGNGGLLSRDTIRAVDDLRIIINDVKRQPPAKSED